MPSTSHQETTSRHARERRSPPNSQFPENGVVVYDTYLYRSYKDTIAMEAVCVLPPSEYTICTTVLNYFLATQVRKWT